MRKYINCKNFDMFIAKLMNFFKISSKEKCYDNMELRGIAFNGVCSGVCGGDYNTGYLSYDCIDCKYFGGFKYD